MFTPRYLLEIIEEIIADALMQMSALMTSHVVRLARIDEEVWLGACCDASLEEGEAVLWHYGHIVQALDNLQLALQVLCLIEQRGLPVTLWVGLWGCPYSARHTSPRTSASRLPDRLLRLP